MRRRVPGASDRWATLASRVYERIAAHCDIPFIGGGNAPAGENLPLPGRGGFPRWR